MPSPLTAAVRRNAAACVAVLLAIGSATFPAMADDPGELPEGLRAANGGEADAGGAKPAITVDEAGYQITWYSLNSSANISLEDGSSSAQISIQGQLGIPAERDPAAYIIEITDVIDDGGRSLMNRKLSRWSGQAQQWPVQRINPNQQNQNQWGIAANLSQLVGWSTTIDRIEGVVYLLEVTGTREVDLPLEPGKKPTELCEGATIKIDKVDRRSNSLTVNYQLASSNPAMLNDLGSPPFMHRQTLMDKDGNPVPVGSAYNSSNGPNQGYVRFYLENAEDGPTTIRMSVATQVTERRMPFTLRGLHINPAPKDKPKVEPGAKADAKPGEAAPAADANVNVNAKPQAAKPAAPVAPAAVDAVDIVIEEAVEPAPAPAPPPVRRGIDGQKFDR